MSRKRVADRKPRPQIPTPTTTPNVNCTTPETATMPFEKTQELIRGRGPQNTAYPSYKSPYGPKYHYQPNVAGWTPKQFTQLGMKAGAFGGVALFAVIFYASGIPRVQNDILMKIPGLRNYYIKDVPASDNPF
ncbi:hypothetical protein PG989_005578 [Apiospora arundinis]